MTKPSYDELATLLSEGLDLCVRARKLDSDQVAEGVRSRAPELAAIEFPRSATPHLWIQDQYDKDLEDWEARARGRLMEVIGP